VTTAGSVRAGHDYAAAGDPRRRRAVHGSDFDFRCVADLDVTLTVIYDPTRLRVRTVQEGSFMRAGGATVAFSQQVTGNRIDITLARGGDSTGASGTGLLAAILFDAVAPGP
jgi:hypothetical protein